MQSPSYEKIITPINDIESLNIEVVGRLFPVNLKGLTGPGTPAFLVMTMKKKEEQGDG